DRRVQHAFGIGSIALELSLADVRAAALELEREFVAHAAARAGRQAQLDRAELGSPRARDAHRREPRLIPFATELFGGLGGELFARCVEAERVEQQLDRRVRADAFAAVVTEIRLLNAAALGERGELLALTAHEPKPPVLAVSSNITVCGASSISL